MGRTGYPSNEELRKREQRSAVQGIEKSMDRETDSSARSERRTLPTPTLPQWGPDREWVIPPETERVLKNVIVGDDPLLQNRLGELKKKSHRNIKSEPVTMLLLQTRALMEYNGEGWYSVHPLVCELLEIT